jgi:DNA-binding beta-propeller fold protein YncE
VTAAVRRCVWCFAVVLSAVTSVFAATLRPVASIDLPGPAGQRFDYLAVDEEHGYVLSAHLGPGLLYVIDIKRKSVIATVRGLPAITGLEYAPGLHKVYTSNWGEEKIGVVDLNTMSVVKRLPTLSKPNGIAYAAPFRKMYVVNTLGKAVSVIDVDKDEVIKVIRFKSETGTPGYDVVSKKMYVTLRSTNEVAEIDPASDRVIGRYPVQDCRFNHGMAIDSDRHRAFLLCGGSRNLTVFDLDNHRAIAHFPLPSGADVVKFDRGLRRAYAACSSGAISVIQEEGPDYYRKIEDFPVQKLVHSLVIDPATHHVYAPEQEENGRPVARIIVFEPIKQ